jgi:coatomer subunit beta'
MVKTYKDFQESKSFKTTYTNEGLFGGRLLGIKSRDLITFYDWEDYNIVRQIELASAPKNVFWSDNGSLTVLALEDTFYLLQYNPDIVENTMKQSAMGKV